MAGWSGNMQMIGGIVQMVGQVAGGYWKMQGLKQEGRQISFNLNSQYAALAAQMKQDRMNTTQMAEDMQDQSAANQAAIRSAYARSGIVSNVGTPLEVQGDQAAVDARRRLQMLADAQLRRRVLLNQQQQIILQKKVSKQSYDMASKQAMNQGIFEGLNTGFSTASDYMGSNQSQNTSYGAWGKS